MADLKDITRRDFLNGIALSLAAGTSLAPLEILAAGNTAVPYYPPALTGLRGNHAGSFETAHAIASGAAGFARPDSRAESLYDLVVVGGGISGLAAARLFRERHGAAARILVLDNHDDFGGHARRNEFTVDGESLIGYGGSQSIDSPGVYSQQSMQLIEDLGIELERFYDYFDQGFRERHGLRAGVYFSQAAYGRDVSLPKAWRDGYREQSAAELEALVQRYPLPAAAQRSLLELLREERPLFAELGVDERQQKLRGMSYSEFLSDHRHCAAEVVTLLRDTVASYWGVGWDALSALEAYRLDAPGTRGLAAGLGKDPRYITAEPYIFHFPDGNASIARALVRDLLPAAVPGSTMEDLVTAPIDYGRLDRAAAATRIRLNATVVDVRHQRDGKAVEVVYLRDGKARSVRGRHVVLACYNRMIPHLCPDIPAAQAEALAQAVKIPICYINIAVRNWRAFAELGLDRLYIPQGELMHALTLDFPVSMGDYSFTQAPDTPTVLHGVFVPTTPDQGLSMKQQAKLGRQKMLTMSFDDYEAPILRQLDGGLSAGGFDCERDVAAITVNRWPHGYAYEYNDLYDPPDWNTGKGPHIAARQPVGRISIANSDASASSYVDGAIDAAWRAVEEQTWA